MLLLLKSGKPPLAKKMFYGLQRKFFGEIKIVKSAHQSTPLFLLFSYRGMVLYLSLIYINKTPRDGSKIRVVTVVDETLTETGCAPGPGTNV